MIFFTCYFFFRNGLACFSTEYRLRFSCFAIFFPEHRLIIVCGNHSEENGKTTVQFKTSLTTVQHCLYDVTGSLDSANHFVFVKLDAQGNT